MSLVRLDVRNFRIIEQAALEFSDNVNLIVGPNASGKTSLLEAIYFLAHARSFRTPQFEHLLRRGADELRLVGRLRRGRDPAIEVLGLRRDRAGMEVRAGGRPLRTLAELAARLPVLAIHPESHALVSGAPTGRRAFMDWGVFHVEQGFYGEWLRYSRALKQRNAALKRRAAEREIRIWDVELAAAASIIDRSRAAYVKHLREVLPSLCDRLLKGRGLGLGYRRGWREGEELAEVLASDFHRDRERGHTHNGPHRADLTLELDGLPAVTGASRGQQKIMVAALLIAQARLYTATSGEKVVMLGDDLASELDDEHRQIVIAEMQALEGQLFLTALDESVLPVVADRRMFHVKQGRVMIA